jgi:osmotically-inducible protein OsmY
MIVRLKAEATGLGGVRRSISCARSFRLQAEALILVMLLTGCGATTSRTNDDQTTSTQVKIALLNDAQVGGLRLDVKTFQGVVTLAGTVRSAADEQHAIALAKRIQGVRDVRSQLKVEAPRLQHPPQ